MNTIRGKREKTEAEHADGMAGGAPARRSVLGGLAALPVLYSLASTTSALASSDARPGRLSTAAAGDLVRGAERRYNAPLLTAGTRLLLPAGVKVPYLFVYGEFGGTDEEPYRNRFYSLALQPMSRNPYLRSTSIN